MVLDGPTGLCQHCPSGEYYDHIGEQCRACTSTCTSGCMFEPTCFDCPPGEIFDIDSMACTGACPTGSIEISSSQISFNSVCKTFDIYVDPFSVQEIELGTLQYPYRTFRAAASEILNYYSHSEHEVSIFMKDGYIEMDTFYFINLTSVKIAAHPDYELIGKRAQIVFTSQTQPGISEKAKVHLLTNADIDPSAIIAAGSFSSTELSLLERQKFGFMLSRTSINIENIDFYGMELSYLVIPLYLQEKELRLGKYSTSILV